MRKITITRENRKFVGCMIDYLCVLDMSVADFTQLRDNAIALAENDAAEWKAIRRRNWIIYKSDRIVPISNGQKISVDIDKQDHQLWVAAETSTGWAFSNQASTGGGDSDASFIIKTHYSFVEGTSLLLEGK